MAAADQLIRPGLQLRIAQVAFWLFALTVILLPVGLGGNRPLPLGLAQAALALTCFLLAVSWRKPQNFRFPQRLRAAIALLFCVALWAWAQTQPILPPDWANPAWKAAADALHTPLHPLIALNPEGALNGLAKLLTYMACGALGFLFGRDPSHARKLVQLFWYSGVAICAYGLLAYLSGTHTVLWFYKWAYLDDLAATFVNRNHFALYAGMVLVSGLGLCLRSWQRTISGLKPQHRRVVVQEWLVQRGLPYAAQAALVCLCILLSHSRAGLVLAGLGVCLYFFLTQLNARHPRRALIVLLIGIGLLLLGVTLLMQATEHFGALFADDSSRQRLAVDELTLRAIADNPWLGYGLDGFQPVWRLYQQDQIVEFNRAHNDWLEAVLDLGIPAALMLFSAFGLLISGLAHGIRTRRQHTLYAPLALTLTIMLLGHALVDFTMQIPGVMAGWAALLGCGLAQSWSSLQKTVEKLSE